MHNIEKIVEFILRYPQHKHVVGIDQIAVRRDLMQALSKTTLRVSDWQPIGLRGSLHQLEMNTLDVLLIHSATMMCGWSTHANNWAISCIHTLTDEATIVQLAARLRGENCRIGFIDNMNTFHDHPIQERTIQCLHLNS